VTVATEQLERNGLDLTQGEELGETRNEMFSFYQVIKSVI
jgi:hypothetical protein